MQFRKLLYLLVCLLLLASCSSSVQKWNEEIKRQKSQKGWLPILEQLNGKRIAFVNMHSPQKIKEGIFYVEILWVNHKSIAAGYPEEVFRTIEDCTNKRSAIIDADTPLNEIELTTLELREIKEDQLQPILCDSLSKL